MKNEEKILWQIKQRGDEFLQDISLILFRYENNGFAIEYGKQKEKDKGRDILRYDKDMYYAEIVQVKYSNVSNKKFTKGMFMEELSKTLLYIILDERELGQKHINYENSFVFGLLLNFNYDKTILDINAEIKENQESVAKILFNKRKPSINKKFAKLKYIDVKDDLIKLLRVLKIVVYNSRYLYEKIILCPSALFQFNDVSFEISKLVDDNEVVIVEELCRNKGMRFLNELEKIEYDKYSQFYTYAIEDYARAFSVFNSFSIEYADIDRYNWGNTLRKKIRRRYHEKKDQFVRKLYRDNNLINTCKDFYCETVVNLESPTQIFDIVGDVEVEKGLYHLEIEEGNLKGWRLDE